MEIENGSEWFHNETLATTTVLSTGLTDTAPREPWVELTTIPGMADGDYMSQSRFRREYTRNEPVTLELLERLGWRRCELLGNLDLRLDDGAVLRWDDTDLTLVYDDIVSYYARDLPKPATLRDLLNVLRVFGITAPVPAAAG